MGYLYFYSYGSSEDKFGDDIVLVPYGVSIFLFFDRSVIQGFRINCSRPLWGIYISIRRGKKH